MNGNSFDCTQSLLIFGAFEIEQKIRLVDGLRRATERSICISLASLLVTEMHISANPTAATHSLPKPQEIYLSLVSRTRWSVRPQMWSMREDDATKIIIYPNWNSTRGEICRLQQNVFEAHRDTRKVSHVITDHRHYVPFRM